MKNIVGFDYRKKQKGEERINFVRQVRTFLVWSSALNMYFLLGS